MKLRSLFFLLIFVTPILSFAQPANGERRQEGQGRRDDESSTLSIFSENGEQFLLVLNGVSQNTMPTSKIRVERLPKYGNEIEIIFADNRTPAIRKTITIADPVDNKAVNMTLKLVRNREGYPRLKFQKCTEVEHDYHPDRDEYVMNYGQQMQNNNAVGAYNNNATRSYNDNVQAQPAGPVAMDPGTFNEVKKTIANTSFDDGKLSVAKTILNTNYFTTNQVIEICKLFSFDDGKLDFAKAAYSKTIDNNNYFKVNNVFSFDSNKQALNDFISGSH